jgi:hypothetical protein
MPKSPPAFVALQTMKKTIKRLLRTAGDAPHNQASTEGLLRRVRAVLLREEIDSNAMKAVSTFPECGNAKMIPNPSMIVVTCGLYFMARLCAQNLSE